MIITRLQGGMGNQMFQYAIGRALSLKYNVPLGLDLAVLLDRTPKSQFHNFTFRNYSLDVFNINVEFVPQENIPFFYKTYKTDIGYAFDVFLHNFLKLKGSEKGFNYDQNIFNVGSNAYLDGHWQSYKYFAGIEDTIRKDFTLKNELPEKTRNLMKEIKDHNSLCIHVRTGNYSENAYREVIDEGYFNRAIEKIKTLTKIDKVYVFSDDIKWCEDNIKLEFPVMFVGDEYAGLKAEGHLALMSACHNFIIPNSSFSWWAAWLSEYKDKIVIAPKQWVADKNVNNDDLVPLNWIKI